jgi:hypothetical protein
MHVSFDVPGESAVSQTRRPGPMTDILPLDSLTARRFDTPAILRKLAAASRQLAESKGIAASIPRPSKTS